MKRPVLIIGAGGFAAEVFWVAREAKEWECVGFADDNPAKRGSTFEGVPILGTVDETLDLLSKEPIWFHCTIGKNHIRKSMFEKAAARNFKPATFVHPSVLVASGVPLGPGTYIAPGAIICPRACIARGVIVNMHVSVGHDSRLDDFSQAAPGCRITGQCSVGELAFLGANASLMPGTNVGAKSTVGANSFVIKDVEPGTSVMGSPARLIYERQSPITSS